MVRSEGVSLWQHRPLRVLISDSARRAADSTTRENKYHLCDCQQLYTNGKIITTTITITTIAIIIIVITTITIITIIVIYLPTHLPTHLPVG